MKNLSNEALLERYRELARQKTHVWYSWRQQLQDGKDEIAKTIDKQMDFQLKRIWNLEKIIVFRMNNNVAC